MQLVVIYGWKQESAELAQAIAVAAGITAFEARQRVIGGGPAVLAGFADPLRAQSVAAALHEGGVAALVVDSETVRGGTGRFPVQRFELGQKSLSVEAVEGERAEFAYDEIRLLLPGIRIQAQSELKTVSERKFSLGKTLLSGGIPLTKKVSRQEEVTTEERTRLLYLFAADGRQAVFRLNAMSYDGLGASLQLSQELNFSYLSSELRRLSPNAVYDDRLVNRLNQVRLLGLAQNSEESLDLAAEILGRTLRS